MRGGGSGDRAVALLVAVALVGASACGVLGVDDDGGDGDASSGGAPTERLRVPDELDAEAGCGEEAATDPADMSAGRSVARCAADNPAPAPLDAPGTVRVGVRSRSEDVAPILLADQFDEFGEENLTVEVVELDSATELFDALEGGELDVVAGDLDGPFFDHVFNGSGARIALGGPVAPSAQDTETPQAGLWLRTDLVDPPDDWMDLEDVGLPVAVEDSIGDAVAYPVDAILAQDDISLNEVNIMVADGESAATALLDGELSGAWLSDPYWRGVVDSELEIELVATLPVAESLGGVAFDERLLDPERDRATGVAFSRAVIRTINTYLAGDYQDDDEVVAALVEATGASEDDIRRTPAWVFDWEVREGTTERIQQALLSLGGVLYEEALPEGRLVDRSLYEDAVAAGN
jgi:NitT/TauT family transport system substrate-binding protein